MADVHMVAYDAGNLEGLETIVFTPGTEEHRRCQKLRVMTIGALQCIDWPFLRAIGEEERARAYIGTDTPWDRLFSLVHDDSQRELTVEFYSTFHHTPRAAGTPELSPEHADFVPEVRFSLMGVPYGFSAERWAVVTGLYTEDDLLTPVYTEAIHEIDMVTLLGFWQTIADGPWLGTKGRATYVLDPLYRYLHRCIASSISARQKSREWVTQQDAFFLYCLLTGTRCDLARSLAMYFDTAHKRQMRGLLFGPFITRIARHLTTYMDRRGEMLPPVPAGRIDERSAHPMQIIRRFPVGPEGREVLRLCDRLGHQFFGEPFPLQAMRDRIAALEQERAAAAAAEGEEAVGLEQPAPHMIPVLPAQAPAQHHQAPQQPDQHPRHVSKRVKISRHTERMIRDTQRRVDRQDDVLQWLVDRERERYLAAMGREAPPLPPARVYPPDHLDEPEQQPPPA